MKMGSNSWKWEQSILQYKNEQKTGNKHMGGKVTSLAIPISNTERLSNLPEINTSQLIKNYHWNPGITLEL